MIHRILNWLADRGWLPRFNENADPPVTEDDVINDESVTYGNANQDPERVGENLVLCRCAQLLGGPAIIDVADCRCWQDPRTDAG